MEIEIWEREGIPSKWRKKKKPFFLKDSRRNWEKFSDLMKNLVEEKLQNQIDWVSVKKNKMLRLKAFRPTNDKIVKIQLHPTHPWLVTADASDHVSVWNWEHRQVIFLSFFVLFYIIYFTIQFSSIIQMFLLLGNIWVKTWWCWWTAFGWCQVGEACRGWIRYHKHTL